MSEEKHLFHLDSVWTGGSDGDGLITSAEGGVPYGRPAQMGGAPGRTNPEEMLLAAVVSCYSIVLSILTERRRLPVTRIEVAAEGEVVRQLGGTLKYTAIRLHPRITLASGEEAAIHATREFARKADQYCPISNAVRGNVDIVVEPDIVTE